MELERFGDKDILLTFQEAAKMLLVSRATMYRLLGSGQLTGHKVGRVWRFYKTDIHSFVSSRAVHHPHADAAELHPKVSDHHA